MQCLQGARKPYLISGETRPFVRVGSSNREAHDEEVRRLLFAHEPQRFLGQTEVACVRFKGIDVVSYIDRRDLRGPLYQLVDDAEQFIYRHMKIGRRIEGFAGVEYREYPAEAVREALAPASL